MKICTYKSKRDRLNESVRWVPEERKSERERERLNEKMKVL